MKEKSKLLSQCFGFVFFQTTVGWVWGNLSFLDVVFSVVTIIMALHMLKHRLERDVKKDFFPEKSHKEMDLKPSTILVLGKELEPASHENEKDDRYFRVLEEKRKIGFWVYPLLFFVLSIALISFSKEVASILDIGPLTYFSYFLIFFLGISLMTRNSNQLLILPSLNFIALFFLTSWSKLDVLSLVLAIFLLSFATFTAFKGLYNLKEKKPISLFQDQYAAVPFCSVLSLVFLLCSPLFNKQFFSPTQAKSDKEMVERINQTLGRLKPNSTNERKVRRMKNLKKGLKEIQPSLKNSDKVFSDAERYLDLMEETLEKFSKDLLKSDGGPASLNQMRNERALLDRDLKEMKALMSSGERPSKGDIEKASKLLGRIDNLSKRLSDISQKNGAPSDPFQRSGSLQEDFKNSLAGGFDEQLSEQAGYVGDEKFIKEFEDLISGDEKENSVSDAAKIYDQKKTKVFTKINHAIKAEEKKKNLMEPKTLEKVLMMLKYLLFLMLGFFIFQGLKKYFNHSEEEVLLNELSVEEKKRLLLKRKYDSDEEEIRTLFLQYSEAIKKIYYQEEEPPPPKILYKDLLEFGVKRVKSLRLFLEVFSLSEYGSRKINSKTLKNYRRAYRRLVKDL